MTCSIATIHTFVSFTLYYGTYDSYYMQIRQYALDLVQGLTGSPEGLSLLATQSNELVLPLLVAAGSGPATVSRSALISLVNLSQEPSIQSKLLDLNATSRCMDYLKEGVCSGHENLLVMLLANLTAAERGSEALLQLDKKGIEGLHVSTLIRKFMDVRNATSSENDKYEHVATILPNVTRFACGRRLLLEPGRGMLAALVSQLRSQSSLRRRGCSGAIKNCCLSCEEDGTAHMIAENSNALSDILIVLAGTDESLPAKDDIVRENLADAILSLAKVAEARKKLWEANAPELLRKAYEYEEHPGTCKAMESAAALFLEDGFQPHTSQDDDYQSVNAAAFSGGRPNVQIEEIE